MERSTLRVIYRSRRHPSKASIFIVLLQCVCPLSPLFRSGGNCLGNSTGGVLVSHLAYIFGCQIVSDCYEQYEYDAYQVCTISCGGTAAATLYFVRRLSLSSVTRSHVRRFFFNGFGFEKGDPSTGSYDTYHRYVRTSIRVLIFGVYSRDGRQKKKVIGACAIINY